MTNPDTVLLPARRMAAAVVATVLLVGLTIGTAPAASAAAARSTPPAVREINGVCGTLLGVGTSTASMFKQVAARGAGWVSLVLAAGCLTKDVVEYSEAFNASPEGLASIRQMKARYAGWGVADWMSGAGCTYRVRRSAIADSVDAPRAYWDCSRSPYIYSD
ncbi:hypothetical protein [Pseudonocardia spirodelae]|uniref:Secreted protein n=1 Tax=Pseudonocardia spirodelae TaxID=3133431 RepID=A0ABU8T571_9PSEU